MRKRPIGAERAPRRRLVPGQVIPGTSWRITKWLGEGGMGVVYEARHVEINRRAAIKIVAASLSDDLDALQDFRREASASARIGSPNIIDVFDFEVLDDGRLLMAMEFVPGSSLRALHLAEGCISPNRLIGLFRQVCKGLQAAHDAGLVHRDIKPDNIMVGEIAGRRDTVKLVDFGIVSIMGERSVRNAGTPSYMPPESSQDEVIDGRYDIYSVGCVMYEMLTGRPPFIGDSVARVFQMHAFDVVPELVTYFDEVPPKLVEAIYRCLAKQPGDRYASMNELEAALCEAQIEGKLHTAWDDLELPNVDAVQRASLQAKMPTRMGVRGVSRGWLPVLLLFGVVVGCVFAWPMVGADPVLSAATDVEISSVRDFVDRAHESAALAYFVYPPVDNPEADTAYKMLMQLEQLERPEARVAADLLRSELASTLVRVGDEMWGKDGGEPFALDFYVQAIMFDPSIEPARTRASMSLGELLALRRKAGSGEFTESELIAVEPLQAWAAPSLAERQAALEAIRSRRLDQRRASATAQLDVLIDIESGTRVRSKPGLQPDDLVGPVEVAGGSSDRKGAADSLVAKANAARNNARLNAAEKLYHRALRIEEQRVDALAGLGHIYHEQGEYSKAVIYYEMAVRRAGHNAAYRIALGDAYFKTLAYAQALEQYERAKLLGSNKADDRIERVERRTGG